MNWLDRTIAFFSPSWGLQRLHARATMTQIQSFTGTGSNYNAAKMSRLSGPSAAFTKENDVSGTELDRLRAESWRLYRNNPTARKIMRSLESKVIGRGLRPLSKAMTEDGKPDAKFRKRAIELWDSLESGFDSRGMPAKGGLSMQSLQKLALRSVALTGNTLYRMRPIDTSEKDARGLPIAYTLQLMDSCRLAGADEVRQDLLQDGRYVWRGIELDSKGNRTGYWLKSPAMGTGAQTTADPKRFDVAEIGHLFIEEDIDQMMGVPWFASVVENMRQTGDLQYNVLMATAMAACVVGAYSKPTGAARFGLNQSAETVSGTSDGTDLTDANGNTISKIQPGLIVNKGKDGSFELMSPNPTSMSPESFVNHLQRTTATGLPGIKSSTITGDYRNSSFSSERSADNDIWPEVVDLQDWFAAGFCQPIYEVVIRAGVLSGWFGELYQAEFQANPARFSAATWQGPIQQSINPGDDAEAQRKRTGNGTSSVQLECAKTNRDWREIFQHAAELYAEAEANSLPPEYVNNMLGIDSSDTTQGVTQQSNENQQNADSGVNADAQGVAVNA